MTNGQLCRQYTFWIWKKEKEIYLFEVIFHCIPVLISTLTIPSIIIKVTWPHHQRHLAQNSRRTYNQGNQDCKKISILHCWADAPHWSSIQLSTQSEKEWAAILIQHIRRIYWFFKSITGIGTWQTGHTIRLEHWLCCLNKAKFRWAFFGRNDSICLFQRCDGRFYISPQCSQWLKSRSSPCCSIIFQHNGFLCMRAICKVWSESHSLLCIPVALKYLEWVKEHVLTCHASSNTDQSTIEQLFHSCIYCS